MRYWHAAMDSLLEHTLPPPLAPRSAASMDICAEISPTRRQLLAWEDVRDGIALWRLGVALGWLDIKLKYRGSLLGPFWLTLTTAIWIAAMGGIYGILFHVDLHTYLPFLALSLVLWNALSGLVTDACSTFLQAEFTIKSVRMPHFLQAIRVVVSTVITFAHNIPVIIAVFAIFHTWPGWISMLCAPGLLLWAIDAFAACLMLGAFCARFRDIPPIVNSIMQITFYITPIIWRPEQLGSRGWWLPYNPFDALLDVVRAPLLGDVASHKVWGLALGYSFMFLVASWLFFARVRGRIAYWV